MAKRDIATDAIHQEQSSFAIQRVIPLLINNIRLQLLKNDTDEDVPYIPVLKGHPGTAKTRHIKLIAKELGLELYYVSIGAKPMEFLSGLPITNKLTFENDKDRKNTYVYWSEPELIHCANEIARKKNNNGCLVFLDDMHVADPSLQKYMFEFILERKLGNYKLDKNVAIVGAMNSSSQAGFDGFFSAIINRIQMLPIKMHWKYWYEAVGAELNPLVATFVKYHGDSEDMLQEDERQDRPFATYRSWSQISMMLDYPYEEYLKNKNNINEFLEQVYMIVSSYTSSETALVFKNETMQLLKYDYQGMVKNNNFRINFDDPISQYSFGNVIRYFTSKKDVDNLVKYIVKLIETEDENKFSNAIMNIMYELSSMSNIYNKKNSKEAKEKLEIIRYCQKEIFAHGHGMIHKMMADINDQPFNLN